MNSQFRKEFMNANEISQLIADSPLSLEEKLSWHLTGVHFPPITEEFIPVAKSAIELAKNGEWYTILEYPNGLRKNVYYTIEGMHLHFFLNE